MYFRKENKRDKRADRRAAPAEEGERVDKRPGRYLPVRKGERAVRRIQKTVENVVAVYAEQPQNGLDKHNEKSSEIGCADRFKRLCQQIEDYVVYIVGPVVQKTYQRTCHGENRNARGNRENRAERTAESRRMFGFVAIEKFIEQKVEVCRNNRDYQCRENIRYIHVRNDIIVVFQNNFSERGEI